MRKYWQEQEGKKRGRNENERGQARFEAIERQGREWGRREKAERDDEEEGRLGGG